jgi:hypothetical protein
VLIGTHYDTLGVAHDATTAEIRAAYVARARRHHPDVASPAEVGASMAELNRAYEVLRRQATRVAYDEQLRSRPASRGPMPSDEAPEPPPPPSPGAHLATRWLSTSGPARMPWKLMAVAAIVGSGAVLASAALVEAPRDEAPDGILRVGSCVAVEPNNDVREVACTGLDDLVVRLLLPTDATCPAAYLPHRDRLGLGLACVEAAS